MTQVLSPTCDFYNPSSLQQSSTFFRKRARVVPLPANHTQCPETHFQCPEDGYCLPVYVKCNDINDCPGHEDEAGCDSYTCPGFYRCQGIHNAPCMHVNHLCDGYPQCPQIDDELMCDVTCPEPCSCSGLAFICSHTFHVSSFPEMRYLDARGSGLHQNDIMDSSMLIYLGVQACNWASLTDITLPNLHSLDLGDNKLTHVNFSHFTALHNLRTLSVAGNPLSGGLLNGQLAPQQPSVLVLNLSGIQMHSFDMNILSSVWPNMELLDVSRCRIKRLKGEGVFLKLRVLDLRGNPVDDFTPQCMRGMELLTHVFASSFKLCCSEVLPLLFQGRCVTPPDEISSCNDLLKSGVYQFTVTVLSVLGILGNLCSFGYRSYCSSERIKTGFAVFVLHLCLSDFLMGVYLAFIGMADRFYGGVYVWKESEWKRSPVCSVAGFLSFLSSEVSAFLIFLITFDRFLVLRFPFSQIRFRATSAHIASVIIWFLGFLLAVIPLLPVTSHWEYYGQTGICIPLPITRAEFSGHAYSFGVMIVFNLILFLLIAVGQSLIFWSVRSNSMSEQAAEIKNMGGGGAKSKDSIIARRLLSIAMSDFLCWFPIGLCGLLASLGTPISGEVNVAMAMWVLPITSILNPLIYTLNIMLEKRQKVQK